MVVEEKQIVIEDVWPGLYGESWKGLICDEAFAHPAKFSRALIRRIYDHVIDQGWAIKGSSVVDPFGGVALGAFDAMRLGLNWHGCELEEKFVGLGSQNIALWNARFSRMPNWGSARLLQGDSRKLAEVLKAAGCCVSSPPYGCDSLHRAVNAGREESLPAADRMGKSAWGGGYGTSEGQLSNLPATAEAHSIAITSPPYSAGTVHDRNGLTAAGFSEPNRVGKNSQARTMANYGDSEGQLGKLPPGDHSIAITSPPYIDSLSTVKHDVDDKLEHAKMSGATAQRATWGANKGSAGWSGDEYGTTEGQLGAMPEGHLCVTSPPYNPPMSQDHNGSRGGQRGTTPSEKSAFVKYGNGEGQLEGMSMEGFDTAISSPPYEGSISDSREGDSHRARKAERFARGEFECTRPDIFSSEKNIGARGMWGGKYSMDPENIGNQRGETFWSASRLILEQLHQVIIPGGHAVFVVKAFVRDKQIVDFPAQWAQLCEAVGFRLLHHHRASLVEHSGTQRGFHEDKEIRVERKSFFRRLAEKKGSPRIDHESVLCFERS